MASKYDLSGLVARLKELALEFKAADEEAKTNAKPSLGPGFRERVIAVT